MRYRLHFPVILIPGQGDIKKIEVNGMSKKNKAGNKTPADKAKADANAKN
ncbi:MAG: hypothetical protein ACM3QV_00190 [Caulobacteraceae bacterium]